MALSTTDPLALGPSDAFLSPESRAEGGSADGHAARVGHLFREHNDALVRFLSARLLPGCSRGGAGGLCSATHLDRPEASSFLKALLYKTAANLAIDRLRHRRLVVGHEQSATAGGLFAAPADAVPAAQDDIRIVSQALDELPPQCRSAFLMSRVEFLDSTEIATRLGVTDRAVRKYIARALVYLQLRLQDAHTPRAP
jgi:RNA polymerase sigma factor (sigma-70 family)